MRRRDFLASTAAVAVVPLLPALPVLAETYVAEPALYFQSRLFFTSAETLTFRWSKLQAKNFYGAA